MKLKIENLKKEPFQSKEGKPFVRVSVLSEGKVYTCLEGKWNQGWATGQEIEVNVKEENFKGKVYNKIEAPQGQFGNPKLDEILENTKKILALLNNNYSKPTGDNVSNSNIF